MEGVILDEVAKIMNSLPRKHQIGKLVFGVTIGFLAKEFAERYYVETLLNYWAKRNKE